MPQRPDKLSADALGRGTQLRLSAIAALLADLPSRWAFCGGWAIDLFLGHATRVHNDVDLAVFRPDQLAIRSHLAARGWALQKVVAGKPAPWQEGEFIRLPVHEVWCHTPASFPDRLELLFNERDGTNFRFRRDPSIVLPLNRAVLASRSGVPVLAPEIVLLYKAKDPAATRNAADFNSVAPHLSAESRTWLRDALTKLYREHPWLRRL